MKRELKLVHLMDAEMCAECRFCSYALVESNGVEFRTVKCSRLDCDNWVYSSAQKIDKFTDLEDVN